MSNVSCRLDDIENLLGEEPLGMPMRDYVN